MNSHWNSTEAYDLSLYEVPAEPAKRPQPVPVAKNKAQSKKAAQRRAGGGFPGDGAVSECFYH